jgi:hypothetical protein
LFAERVEEVPIEINIEIQHHLLVNKVIDYTNEPKEQSRQFTTPDHHKSPPLDKMTHFVSILTGVNLQKEV